MSIDVYNAAAVGESVAGVFWVVELAHKRRYEPLKRVTNEHKLR